MRRVRDNQGGSDAALVPEFRLSVMCRLLDCGAQGTAMRDVTLDDAKTAIGDGWHPLVETLYRAYEFDRENNPNSCAERWTENGLQVRQVKEKFGTLRVYLASYTDFSEGYVRALEALSARMCEDCGAPGKAGGDGWMRTLCPVCRQAYDARRASK